MKFTREQVAAVLTQEWNYPQNQVDKVIDKLLSMDNSLIEAFDEWMETGFLPKNPVIEGFNPYTAWKTYQQKPPAIFLLLDWIKREPAQAMQALQEDYGRTTPVE